jgi:hypothetical protein
MIMCEWHAPEGDSVCLHLYAFVSYRCLSHQFKFSLSAVTLGIYLGVWGPEGSLLIQEWGGGGPGGGRGSSNFITLVHR